jgi:hypothetical protein
LGAGAIASLFATPFVGGGAGVLAGAACVSFLNSMHAQAIANLNVFHQTNLRRCD